MHRLGEHQRDSRGHTFASESIPTMKNEWGMRFAFLTWLISISLFHVTIQWQAATHKNTSSSYAAIRLSVERDYGTAYSAVWPSEASLGSLLYTSHSIDLTHEAPSSTVRVSNVYSDPQEGTFDISLGSYLVDDLLIAVDGQPADFQLEGKTARIVIPPDAIELGIAYSMLDGAISYEGIWYLEFPPQSGVVTIHLPADAVIEWYESEEFVSQIDTHTIRYDIPDGQSGTPLVVYRTTQVPEQYYSFTTPRFEVAIPKLYSDYQQALGEGLESIYSVYSQYSGYDLNNAVGQERFRFLFPPRGYDRGLLVWGLCIPGGTCMIDRHSIPRDDYPPFASPYPDGSLFRIMSHEMAHGWQYVVNQGFLPWWINSTEGYPWIGVHAAFDLGACNTATASYTMMYQGYSEYLNDPSSNLVSANAAMISGLVSEYGWVWLQQLHDAILSGQFDLMGLTDQERDDQAILFLSEAVGENLVPFFDNSLIYASDWVRTALQNLPPTSAAVPPTWSCPKGVINPRPSSMLILVDPSGGDISSAILRVGNSGLGEINWAASEDSGVDWLNMTSSSGRSTPLFAAPIELVVDASGLANGSYMTSLTIAGDEGVENNPATVSIRLIVGPVFEAFLPMIRR